MSTYDEFIIAVKDIHRLQALQGHLGWDRETITVSYTHLTLPTLLLV